MRYLVTTPKSPQYKGVTYGLRFQNGRAVLDNLTVDKNLGLSAEDIARLLKRDWPGGYEVEEIEEPEPQRGAKAKKAD